MTRLEKAYLELEQKCLNEKYTHNLSNIFVNVRDILIKKSENSEALKAQFEIDFLNFNICENKLSFLYSCTNAKGEIVEYPSIKEFTTETYDYLFYRQQKTSSINLKARYSHIIWLSPKKRVEFAHAAIDNYISLVRINELQDIEFPEDFFGLKLLENLKNAFILSLSVNYKIETTKKELIRIIKKFSFTSKSSKVVRFQLIEIMLNHKLVFRYEDYKGILTVCKKMFLKENDLNKHFAIDILYLSIEVAKKTGAEILKYERRIAELWEELMQKDNNINSLVSTDYCRNAIKIYKKLKDNTKVKELEAKYNQLRRDIKLSEFGEKIDITEMMKGFRKYADKLTDKEPFVILSTLMNTKNFLPLLDEVEKQAKKLNENSLLAHFANTSLLDRNGNTAQHFNDKEEYNYFKILQTYHYTLQFSKCNLIREIIFSGIKKGKLNANTFLLFLNKYSWLGREFEMSSNGSKPIPYSWLSLIAPALNEYFVNLEFYFRNQSNYPNFVLCIDSLSLKIEGMLREICEFRGITTFEFKPDKKGRIIAQEKDIHKLLYEPEIIKLFDKDDILFFKFLLVEKAGYNLRHRVAHSLLTFYEYDINHMNLLIMAVLKFGKFNFVPIKKEDA